MSRVLFVAPAVPRPTGSGLRMRGWLFLQALARNHRVTLVAGSPAFPDEAADTLEELGDLVEDAVVLRFRAARDPALLFRRAVPWLSPGRELPADWAIPTTAMRARLSRLQGQQFVGVHVFRLYMLPTALMALGGQTNVPIELDLDDWESGTRRTLAAVAQRDDVGRARDLRAQAAMFEAQERTWLPRFCRVFVCSKDDAEGLSDQYGLRNVVVVGNAVSVPAALTPPANAEPAQLLFIGSLGYYANQDAVSFLLDQVLPHLREATKHPFQLVVAGVGATTKLQARLRAEPGVVWVDSPPDVGPLYERATAALAPLRAGGGTRVKAIEAFAQGRPLVATAAAVSGLGVDPGVHYVHAEDAADWVQVLRSVLERPAMAADIAAAAHAWVRERSLERAVDQVAAMAFPS
jgi:glycosyltransferase involved in cell wall biosynthesis